MKVIDEYYLATIVIIAIGLPLLFYMYLPSHAASLVNPILPHTVWQSMEIE